MSQGDPIIPPEATEEVGKWREDGLKEWAYYYLNGEQIGYRWWDETGALAMEYGMKDGLKHGPFRTWHDNGVLHEESFYVEGREHGIARQYDEDGELIGTYEMVHGTGADLWYCTKGVLAEERYMLDGERHGYERWWMGDNRTIHSEQHFKEGVEHGIHREWNLRGGLRRGFPRYFMNGERVTKRQYLKACASDPTLPPFLEEENSPERPLPCHLMREL